MQIANNWFHFARHPENIIHVTEHHIDQYWVGNIWIVEGSEKCLVVDTGSGIVAPGPLISKMIQKPVIAVALCSYYDHAGGLYSFQNRACHALDVEAIKGGADNNDIGSFIENATLTALPYESFRVDQHMIRGAEITQTLAHGDVIDLGNRYLKVLHIPGRTPGSIALWEQHTGFLFPGETLFVDAEHHDFPPRDVELYEQSIQELAKLPVNKVFGGHYGAFTQDQLLNLVDTELGRYRH